MPAKVNPEEQKSFLETVLKPLIEKAKNYEIELFFMDASHFVMGGFCGKIWGKVRVWIRTASGRKRFNVLGALNFVTKKMTTITNSTYITSIQVMEMLDKLASENIGSTIKIILDNASYQRCVAVTEYAEKLGIELVFLPSYSPNLNLIERVWKFVKSQILNAAYIETFDNFCVKISLFVDSLATLNPDKMDSLVTDRFQLFSA